jgi:hypothetical protein
MRVPGKGYGLDWTGLDWAETDRVLQTQLMCIWEGCGWNVGRSRQKLVSYISHLVNWETGKGVALSAIDSVGGRPVMKSKEFTLVQAMEKWERLPKKS